MADPRFQALKRETLLEQRLPAANPPVRLIKGARIRFAPNEPTGVHRHPVSTVGVVTAGSFVFQPEGEQARRLETGDSFFEPACHTILRFDNAFLRISLPRSSASTSPTRPSGRRSRRWRAAWTANSARREAAAALHSASKRPACLPGLVVKHAQWSTPAS